MANFEEAHKKFLTTQGKQLDMQNTKSDYLLCSDCFKDEGLRILALEIGDSNLKKCKNCKSQKGKKLDKNQLENLSYNFFVRGSFHRSSFGGFPLIQFNEFQYNNDSVSFEKWISDDVKLIEKACKIGFFHYGPRFWMFGEIEPLKSLKKKGNERKKIIQEIIDKYPVKHLEETTKFYRIRLSPQSPNLFSEYDSAPNKFLGSNRFDTKNFPVFYSSPDLELCIHECRATVNDSIFCATVKPKQVLKMLDLTAIIEEDENITEFESLEMAVHFLFLAGKDSYEICRAIAKEAKKSGFDGIIFPSYFSFVRTGSLPLETVYGMSLRKISEFKDYLENQIVPNIAIFGRPVKQNKVNVDCINSVQINKIEYQLNFGTIEKQELDEEEYVESKTNEFIKAFKENLKRKI